MIHPKLPALLLGVSLLCGACGGEPEDPSGSDQSTSDQLSGMVRVTATLEGEFSLLTANALFASADADETICLRATNGYEECFTKGELRAEHFCLAAQEWAKPGVLVHPEVLTKQLLGEKSPAKQVIPTAIGASRATTNSAYSNQRVTCSFRPSDGNVDPRYQRVFTVDVPANTPGLEKVDGKTYTTRFDLPDFISQQGGMLESPYFAPDPKAQWVEAGQITVRYKSLERL